MEEPKLYPRDYTINIKQVEDYLEVHILPLDITVKTEPGKTSTDDAFELAYAAIEQSLHIEYEAAIAARTI